MENKFSKIKESLLREQASLEKQLSDVTVETPGGREPLAPNYGVDETENSMEITDLEINSALTGELGAKLSKVQDALARIQDGTYGKCSNCDQEIPMERLEAEATADMCLECANKLQ